ncbi:MAG TPA: translocation protein TolB [Edaphobacter sp.]|jgi:TolB protein|nr:translocation protein TolB [Edaphobacter sp.]
MHSEQRSSPIRNGQRSCFAALLLLLACTVTLYAQEGFHTETSTGVTNVRIAVADFKSASSDPQTDTLKRTFDTTLFADLANAGIFDIVSKSLLPQSIPGTPAEIKVQDWALAPTSAAMVAFGNFGVQAGKITCNGFLFDAKNVQYPQVLAKQYNEDASDDSARQIAHRFADEIIFRLSGGSQGIAESKIYYVKINGGNKEIWEMDYDGANQHALTNLGTVSLSPRISPDSSRLAFASLGHEGFQIRMFSLVLNRMVNFSSVGGTNITPAWSPNGKDIAYSSSRSGDPEIWVSDSNGALARRITSFRGPDVSPVFNPRTGSQIAWISGRTGLPQLYIMDVDGSAVQRMTDGGYATSVSWSPNGQFLAFAWDRKYGPGAPGGQDIYIMEIATKRWIQLTHDGGRCDFPSWSPDGRHIVYANTADGKASHMRIMTMLADGTQKRELTGPGADMPNWSWK